MVTADRYRLPLERAAYGWPDGDAITVRWYGSGDGPSVALALLPHANEPLGYAIARPLAGLAPGAGRVAVIGPVDPPPAAHRFPMPCDLREFLRTGYLQPLDEQVEFAHRPDPVTPAQRRAAHFRELVREAAPDVLVLVHNDPFAPMPYLYADRRWPGVERRLIGLLASLFPDAPLPLDEVDWTHHLSGRTYAYFEATRIDVTASECAGFYLPGELGIPVVTAELPMFRWRGFTHEERVAVRDAMSLWIETGCGDRAPMLEETGRLLAGRPVPMVPAQDNARVLHAVLEGLR